MVLQSTFYDPVIGLDIHLQMVPVPPAPPPAGVPTPFPMPFMGMVFDPMGLVIGAAMGMALGGGPGVVLVNGMPVTNCGTEVTNKLTMPHLFIPPGFAFVPPPMPDGDATLMFGSLNVSLGGTLGVRLGDIAMSCSDPVRLPTSVVMAIPKGMPVLNMPPPVPDLAMLADAAKMKLGMKFLGSMARRAGALFRKFRGSNFAGKVSKALGGCKPPANVSRLREMWHRGVRFVTGHPVDVVTGNLFTDVVDAELPGPIPLVFERVYESARSHRLGRLGHGWSHSLDEAFWLERGRAVVRLGDGREVEFPLWNLPDRTLRDGDSIYLAIHKLTLRYHGGMRASVEHRDGTVHEFAPVAGGEASVARLTRIRSLDGIHAIGLTYDAAGRLEYVRDSGGRLVHFEHDAQGRLSALKLPVPHERGWYVHRRYFYDRSGDLVEVKDSKGASYRYQYQGHLLVQETDRVGLSFYFQYDGTGAIAKCVRTWGDGGIYDHVIHYDGSNKKTTVENSLGAVTVYEWNERNQVVVVRDPVGAVTRFEYDPGTGGTTLEVSPTGGETVSRYDARGNLLEVTNAVGAVTRFEHDGFDRPVRAIDPRGAEWRWRYDAGGRLVERRFPTGEGYVYDWERGLLRAVTDAQGRATRLGYDERANVSSVTLPNGGVTDYTHDELGRVVKTRNARGGVERSQYDSEGRLLETYTMVGTVQRQEYDAEGNLLRAESATRDVRFCYGHYHRVLWREEDETRVRFEYDTEDQLVGVVNEAGERYGFELDQAGRAVAETGFDGRTRRYVRDRAGQPTLTLLPSGRTTRSAYDVVGRLVETKHSDGTFARFEYGSDGLIARAENESSVVEMERDPLGRIVREVMNGVEVRSTYDASDDRTEMTTSLETRVVVLCDALGLPQDIYLGRIGAMRDPDIHIDRDGLGLEIARCFSNGIEVEWSRDVAGRPTERRTFRRNETQGLRGGASPSPSSARPLLSREVVDERSYEWRGDDQIAAIRGCGRGAILYDHDRRGRLIREHRPDRVVERVMDIVGNIYRTPDGRDRRYGAGGRLELADGVRYEYDEDGNQTLNSAAVGDWMYHWNGHGMLREVERPDGVRVQFEYDCFARRTVKRVVAEGEVRPRDVGFVWDGNDVIHEIRAEGATTWVFEPDAFAPMAKIECERRYGVVSDHTGSPTELRDDAGEVAWRAHLDVYGAAEIEVMREGCPWRWPGQHEDEETGLFYNRFRYYSARCGRYLSEDPIGIHGGLGQYEYVPDPALLIDPLGLQCKSTFNGNRGRAKAMHDLERNGYTIIGEEVTMRVNGSRFRADITAVDRLGNIHVFEVKHGGGRLTKNQSAAGVFDIGSPSNDIQWMGGGQILPSRGREASFDLATNSARGDSLRKIREGGVTNATFHVLKYF